MEIGTNSSAQNGAELMRNRIEEIVLKEMSERMHSMSNDELVSLLEDLLENTSSQSSKSIPPTSLEESKELSMKENDDNSSLKDSEEIRSNFEINEAPSVAAQLQEQLQSSPNDTSMLESSSLPLIEDEWSSSIKQQLQRMMPSKEAVAMKEIASRSLIVAILLFLIWAVQSITKSSNAERDKLPGDNIEATPAGDDEGQMRTVTSGVKQEKSNSRDSFWGVSRLLSWGRPRVFDEDENLPQADSEEAHPTPFSNFDRQPELPKNNTDNCLNSESGLGQEEGLKDSVLWRREDLPDSQCFEDGDGIFLVEHDGVYAMDQSMEHGSKWKPTYWIDPWLDSNWQMHDQNGASIDENVGPDKVILEDKVNGEGTTSGLEGTAISSQDISSEEVPKVWATDVSGDTLHSNVDDSKTSQLAKIAVIGSRRSHGQVN